MDLVSQVLLSVVELQLLLLPPKRDKEVLDANVQICSHTATQNCYCSTARQCCPGRRTKCNGCLNRRTGESVLSKFRQNIQAFQPAQQISPNHEQGFILSSVVA